MALYTQAGRLISLSTPLGDDKLLLTGFTGREAISRLFDFHLTTLSEDTAIDFTQIVGQDVTIHVTQFDDSKRHFNGIVSHFSCTGKDGDMTRYVMQVAPKLWTLTRYADCRIFHNKDVTEIVKSVLDERGITYQASFTGTYKKLEYCVQYRETDFNFISRLMEQFGIFYFFQHDDGSHTMMLGDSSSVHQDCSGQSNAGFNLATGGLDAGDVVNAWSISQELRSGKHSLTDYNFITSTTDLGASESTIYSVGGNDSMEVFDYPGLYYTQADGTAMAKLRMQEDEAVHKIAHGASVCRAFTTGYKFNLTDHPLEVMNATYVLTEIQHVASVSGTYREEGGTGEDSYSNHFTCIPADVAFRPERVTPKPFVQGPQTAVVVGKSADQDSSDDQGAGGDGEEIWVDKWGRVLVLFPWDRKKATSCWMRVSQDWAGQGWGMINIPRVGQEVIVSFLEGDPDRPIITGRVYNDVQVVPYTLPDMGTRTTFRTSTSKGGGTDHYNELRFEDKQGKEQVFLRAEFDQDNYVKNDSREWIGNNRSLVVTKDQMEQVKGNLSLGVEADQYEKVGGDLHLTVKGEQREKISGDLGQHLAGNWNHKSDQNVSIQAGMNMYEKSGQNWAHEAGMAIHLKAGMTVVIEAGMQLSLKAGSSFIDIGPEGIAISGTPMVMINSGGSAGSGSGSSPTSPASPKDPKEPDLADDGQSGTKRGGGSSGAAGGAAGGAAAGGAGGSAAAGAAGGGAPGGASSTSPFSPSGPSLQTAAFAAIGGQAQQAGQQALGQAQQAAQQATQQAAQIANQAAQAAQQAADQAQQAAQQAQQQAQQAVNQVTQQARQAYQQANQAVQQAQQAVNQAASQAQAQAQQALNQAQQLAQQTAQQAAQAVQQAQQQAQQVQQQAQQAAQQAQQAAQQAQQQAQQAAQQGQQQAQQAVQQGQQAVQQAQQQAQQAAQQAQQAAQQAQQQAQQAAHQAQQAAQQAQQAAQQVQQSASQSLQQAQQSAKQTQQAAQQAISQAGHGI